MRTHTILLLCAIICGLTVATGCRKSQERQKQTYTYTIFTPVYESRSEVYAQLNGDPGTPIETAGKIYVNGNYIYVNEIDKGIHVIDNSSPAHPFQTAFIRIPGNRDIAIRSNILYADMYSELLAINISDIHHVNITSNLGGVFIDRGGWYGYNSSTTLGDTIFGVNTRDTTVAQTIYLPTDCINCQFETYASVNKAGDAGSGKAGSMARMVLMNDQLYTIAEPHSLGIINVADPAMPKSVSTVSAGFDLETIFPFENKLFLGSSMGMYMYDVSDRENPVQLGTFTHGRACDPVIADNQTAYVTLHAGTSCGGNANELDVIDIKDLMNPVLLKSYTMTSPKGLSKDGNLLFVCDGDALRVFDAANPVKLNELAKVNCPDAYDVIAGDNLAIVVTKTGLHQYDYSNPRNIYPLSVVKMTIK